MKRKNRGRIDGIERLFGEKVGKRGERGIFDWGVKTK